MRLRIQNDVILLLPCIINSWYIVLTVLSLCFLKSIRNTFLWAYGHITNSSEKEVVRWIRV